MAAPGRETPMPYEQIAFERKGRVGVFKHWGNKPDNRADFEPHFRFDSVKPWKNHTWTPGGRPFEAFHGKQALEWQVFDFASTRDAHAAKLSISMGGPQILGSNFAEMGFESVEQMFMNNAG